MDKDILFKELTNAMGTRARLGDVEGLGEDVARAEIRYWNATSQWFDNQMLLPFYSKGNALDGFCPHPARLTATRTLALASYSEPAEEVTYDYCPDCGAHIGIIGWDFSSREDNRHAPELA